MLVDEEANDERMPNGSKRNLFEALLSLYSSFENELETVINLSNYRDLVEKADEKYQKLWNIGLEIGLGIAGILNILTETQKIMATKLNQN